MAENGNDASRQNGRGHVSIEISDLDKRLADSMQKELDAVSPSPFGKSCCIYKVHKKLRKINEHAYTPEMVSIGPFHHKPCLKDMEEHKLLYVKALLSRTQAKLEECLASIRMVEDEARKCYSELINFDSEGFVKMMVLDGLFIIELFYKSAADVEVDRDDRLFNNIWGMASLVRDMMLLENQIPMLVLTRLFHIVARNQNSRSLVELSIRFFNPLMERDEEVLENYFNKSGNHLLDLFGKTFHDFDQNQESRSIQKLKHIHIPCATELRQAGVRFVKNSDAKSFLIIRFDGRSLRIPPVLIQDQTDSLFRNLIASEQCCDGQATYMTSYAFLMDSLINSPNDVAFLRSRGIITNYLGDDKDVSSLFNKLCSEVTLVNFYYHDLCNEVNRYSNTPWHRRRATLSRDYCNNPWASISVIAACILLLLTFASTSFSGLSFFVHKS